MVTKYGYNFFSGNYRIQITTSKKQDRLDRLRLTAIKLCINPLRPDRTNSSIIAKISI